MPFYFTVSRQCRLLIFVLACSAIIAPSWSSPPQSVSVSPSTLRRVPASVAISSGVLQLQAEAWRDFMPVCMMGTARQCAPDGGRPMMVVFNLIFRSGTRPRTPLHAQKVWVVQGKSVWETTNIEQPGDALDDVRMTVRGGPNWTPRSLIDVIVRFVDDQGRTIDIAVRKQPIRASV